MRDRVLNSLPRSNNSVEGFHNALRSSVTSMHPHIWKLCTALKKEKGISQTKIDHLRRGNRPSRKKTYEVIDARLKRQVEEYRNGNDFFQFLRDIARSLH